MNQYLLAEENRENIQAHNESLVVTTTKQVGRASYVSYDFNRDEEFRLLDALVQSDDADSLTVRMIAKELYGSDDDSLTNRVRSSLKFNSPYQKRLRNGIAVIARQDGTLRITRSADEFGDLVEENIAQDTAGLGKVVRQRAARLNRTIALAIDKVPELGPRLEQTRQEARTALSSVFSRQLELLSGED
jgi:hypothetical protein